MPSEWELALPVAPRQARFRRLYSELALHRAVLSVYTKPLFAWRKALNQSFDERTLYDFARHTPQNVANLHEQLARQRFTFRPGLPAHFNFNGKLRTIFVFPWEERIVDRLLYEVLNRHFHSALSPNCYAYRARGYGLDPCQRRIAQLIAQCPQPLFFAKRDVQDYFPSVDHATLLSLLAQWLDPGDYLFELVRQRVHFQYLEHSQTVIASQGIPFGSAVACWLANVYLTPLDRALAEFSSVRYFRYADDLLLASPDRSALQSAVGRVGEVMNRLQLTSKPSAHRDFSLRVDPVDDPIFPRVTKFRHLGLEFRADGSIGLSRDKARKIRNLFRFAWRRARGKFRRRKGVMSRAQLAVDIARQVLENGVRQVAIIDYYLKHVDDEDQLRQIDRWLAEEVLFWTFQNGHRKSNFRRLPFQKLREMGLPSLCHRRRLLRHGQLESSFFRLRTDRLKERERKWLPGRQASSPDLEAAAKTSSWEGAPPVDRCH